MSPYFWLTMNFSVINERGYEIKELDECCDSALLVRHSDRPERASVCPLVGPGLSLRLNKLKAKKKNHIVTIKKFSQTCLGTNPWELTCNTEPIAYDAMKSCRINFDHLGSLTMQPKETIVFACRTRRNAAATTRIRTGRLARARKPNAIAEAGTRASIRPSAID